VQAQDLRAARLALRARAPGLVASDVGPGLVRTWLCRGTLHLVAAGDWPWLHAITAPRSLTSSTRRLAQLGAAPGDAERIVALVGEEGPLTRREIAARLGSDPSPRAVGSGPSRSGGGLTPSRSGGGLTPALPHLLHRAALHGRVVMDGERFVRVDPPPPVDRDTALAELARRYLRGHGPATAADLAGWAGLPLRDARAGLAAIARELVQHGDLVDLAAREPAEGALGPRLLPAFDPYLLGWRDRSFAVPPALAKRVHPGGGIIRATATIDGVAVGTWSAEGLDVPEPATFSEEAADVARFLAG
jgi:hypothetical protein